MHKQYFSQLDDYLLLYEYGEIVHYLKYHDPMPTNRERIGYMKKCQQYLLDEINFRIFGVTSEH